RTCAATAAASAERTSERTHYGVRLVRDPAGDEWLEVPSSRTGRLFPYVGAGYQHGLTGDAMGHVVLAGGLAWVARGELTGLVAQGRRARVRGPETRLQLFGQAAVPVASGAERTQLAAGLRGRQMLAFGRHALLLVASAAARFDTVDRTAGLELTLGPGYALLLPPIVVPVLLELVYERFGVYGSGALGVRVSAAW
ncbi:MAG: hypothetical protein ACODAU_11945, partial [Myxococcota bacterium]